tara:strand:+ start:137 stop:535 length:399 start_codon:yes stop_codon:yes gene_type:complete
MNAQTNTKKVYEPIPVGEYLAKVGRFTEKATKAGNGSYVTGTFEILEGDHAGRLVFQNFMLSHPNPKSVEIGNEQLSKFLKAVGQGGGFDALGNDVTALEEYTNRACVISVGIKEGTNGYKDSNMISKWATR